MRSGNIIYKVLYLFPRMLKQILKKMPKSFYKSVFLLGAWGRVKTRYDEAIEKKLWYWKDGGSYVTRVCLWGMDVLWVATYNFHGIEFLKLKFAHCFIQVLGLFSIIYNCIHFYSNFYLMNFSKWSRSQQLFPSITFNRSPILSGLIIILHF